MANFNFKQITLPNGDVGTVYDEEAQSIAAAASSNATKINNNLNNNTYSFLTYKDNTHTEAQIKALTSAKVGDFYIASDTGTAWVCVTAINGTASASSWEKAGSSAFEGHQVGEFVLKTDVVDNLTSTATNVPLSAAQGKALKDNLDAIQESTSENSTNITNLTNNITNLTNNITNLTNNKLDKSGGTLTGALVAQNNSNYTTKQVRNVILSTSEPTSSDGANGDIWIKYTN